MSDPITRLNAALEGRYHIERQLGEGGMATVYLADDLRHERKVALKVLKPELAAVVGAERFLAEIKTTANLQHPHILPLFDSGEADSFLFYVMPYVEGESLRERLDREHQLPVDEAVQIAKNVAEALDYAHRHDVIHRDIKPANILLQDGKPVVSDFGIALAVGAAGGGRLTETGLSLGTPYYMSPEQATGDLSVGPAADIYALGCVLYETLVGSPPFVAGTPQAVLGKIVTGDAPSAMAERKSVPPNVDAAISKALEKVPADRFRTAQELAGSLSDSAFRHGDAARVGAPGKLWNPLSIGLAASTLVFGLGLAWSVLGPRAAPSSPPVSRHVISAPPAAPVTPTANSRDVAISPDGRTVVYSTSVPGVAVAQLAVRTLDELETVTLEGANPARGPSFSPDGEWITFMAGLSGGPLERVSLRGGAPRMITELTSVLKGASWGPDDQIVFGVEAPEGLYRVPATGGDPEALTEPAGVLNHGFPDVLPNGAGVLFAINPTAGNAANDQIAVLDTESGEYRVIIESGTFPRYAPSGHILYVVGSTLMAVPFDADRLEVTGEAVPVVEGILVKANGSADFGFSETGSLVYVTGSAAAGSELVAVWVNRDGTEEALPLPVRAYTSPRLSPDGTRLAVAVTAEDGSQSLWVYDVSTGRGLRLTQTGAGGVGTPVWTRDGRIVFSGTPSGGAAQVYVVAADGSGEAELLVGGEEGIIGDYPTSVSPDGRYVVFTRIAASLSIREIFQAALDGDPVALPLLQGDFARGNAEVSPDGRWLVYRSDQSGEMDVYVQPYPGPGPTIPVSISGGTGVTWSPDGTELIYRLEDRMMAVSFDGSGDTPRIGPPTELFRGQYSLGDARMYHIAPDGRFLMLKPAPSVGQEDAPPPQVVLVENFFEELERLAPAD